MDWVEFLKGYDLWPPLQSRLMLVREHLASALMHAPHGPIQITSICAGDGRDVIGALEHHPRRKDVSTTLIELNAELVSRGRNAAAAMNMSDSIHFLNADATLANTYYGTPVADVLLMAGVLGNVRERHERMLIDNLAQLCRAGTTLIWTRGSAGNENLQAVQRILALLGNADFVEVALSETNPAGFVVGSHRFDGKPRSLNKAARLFEFTDYDQMTS